MHEKFLIMRLLPNILSGLGRTATRLYSQMSAPVSLTALPEKYLPPIHRNLTKLDRGLFSKKIELVSVLFPDPKCLQSFMKSHRTDLLNLRGTSNIAKDPSDGSRKVILLNDRVSSLDLELANMKENVSEQTLQFLKANDAKLAPYTLEIGYDFWRMEEILNAILPEELLGEIPTSFTIVGHIAHFNLREEYLSYKNLIGEVVMDKNPKIKTVVNKTSTIGTEFRTFPMELIAGEPKYDVEQPELNCVFRFNFKDVYWNSRLQGEHHRLITTYFKKGEVVCDAMAGVGPFALPAAKNKTIVMANDLNPQSYKYLEINNKLNKTEKFVRCYNIDGAEMIKKSGNLLMEWYQANEGKIVSKLPVHRSKKRKAEGESRAVPSYETVEIPKHISHYVMNLPDSALTFLDKYIGVYSNEQYEEFIKGYDFKLPYIHVYCFQKFSPEEVPAPSFEELESRLLARINEIMSYNFDKNQLTFHVVRKVAPTKYMYCVSFQLPHELAFKKID